jgi:RNA polymerase-binding protein DksA
MSLDATDLEKISHLIDERHHLLAQEIREDVNRAREHTRPELAGPAPDPGDSSVADLIADMDNSELLRDAREIRELEAARERIARGTYGKCEDCGRDIGVERLRAQPTARRCIECQSVHERTFASPGAPTL